MNLLHLRYALEIYNSSSINKAAKNLYMSQPNLSSAIKSLESEIGIIIFERNSKGVQPTAEGEKFLSYASTIISQFDELESLYRSTPEDSFMLNVSSQRSTYICSALSDLINQFDQQNEIKVTFRETNTMGVINDVSNGTSEMGIIRYNSLHENYFLRLLESKGLVCELLWEFEMLVTMSQNHPLAHYEQIPYHELAYYTEIVHGDAQIPPLKFSSIKYSSKSLAPCRKIFVYDRGSHINLLVNVKDAFMWVPLLPKHTLDRNHLIQRKCNLPSVLNKDLVIYSAQEGKSDNTQKFMDALNETIINLPNDGSFFIC